VNDPYSGGTRLMGVKMVKPFFYRDELFGYRSNTGHWPDMGGSVPRGFGTKNTEVYQEGLRIPVVRACIAELRGRADG
jgi:N-methylhydantoinase B